MDLPDQPDEASRAERASDASAGARFRGHDRTRELLGRGPEVHADVGRPPETLAGAADPCRTGPFGRSGGDVPQQGRLQAGPGTARRNRRGNPYGLVRRLEFDGDGFTDEGLRKDFSWAFTPAIVEWKHGDFADELVEVSHEQAERIVRYFRERWGPHGQ